MTAESIRLKYGSEELSFPVEADCFLGSLAPKRVAGLTHPADSILHSLRQPLGMPALRDIAAGGRTAAILVSGRDRTTGSDIFTKLLADELNAAGIPDERITIYLATGTHAHQSEQDKRSILGDEAIGRLACVQHNPRDAAGLTDLGTTSFGTPIRINRAAYESDVKVLTGRIAHHYFAGFSGGRKAIAPGVSSFETIVANHRRVMRDDGLGRHPQVRLGNLEGNPVHLDMLEIACAARPSFCLNTILNVDHQITNVFAGDYLQVHAAGCRVADAQFRLKLSEPATVAIASCGGWPYDISFMQVVKTIVAAEAAVADQGVLIVIGQCERGLEPGFKEWFAYPTLQELNAAVLAHYNLKGHNSYWIREIQARINLVLLSNLPKEDVRALGFHPASTPAEALAIARRLTGSTPRIAAIPFGNITVFES